MRQKMLILFLLLLSVIPQSLAVWDASTDIVEVTDGDIVPLADGTIIRALEVWSGGAFLSVERSGRVLGSGEVRSKKPLVITNTVQITYHGEGQYQAGSPVAKLTIYEWVDAEFTAYHFPKVLNLRTLYDVFARVKNTGNKDAMFTVELTQAGKYVRSADRFEDEEGNLISRVLEVNLPFRDIPLTRDQEEMVFYERIAGVSRQPPGPSQYERSGDVVFNLYHKGALLDTLLFEDILLTPAQSGYIQHIRMPATLVNDHPSEIEFDIVNAGPEQGGQQRSKFNLHLRNKDFAFSRSTATQRAVEVQVSPDIVRGDLLAYLMKTWNVKLTSYAKPGYHNVQFDLEHDGIVYDTYLVPVEVKAGARTSIERVTVPENVKLGEEIPVTVRVHNTGLGRTVLVKVTGPMIEIPLEKSVQMKNDQTQELDFTVEATGSGHERIEASVLVVEPQPEDTRYLDPYTTNGYTVDTKSALTYVVLPEGAQAPVAPLAPRVEPPLQPRESVSLPAPAVAYTPPAASAPSWDASQAGPVMIVALVILIILVVMKLIFYYTE